MTTLELHTSCFEKRPLACHPERSARARKRVLRPFGAQDDRLASLCEAKKEATLCARRVRNDDGCQGPIDNLRRSCASTMCTSWRVALACCTQALRMTSRDE